MKLNKSEAEIFVPDGAAQAEAVRRTTHLGVGAHQDDLEIMCYHGIAECFDSKDEWFTGVTCTNGAGSPRSGCYGQHSDEQMRKLRLEEQRQAARIGRYAAMLQLNYSSSEIKDPRNPAPAQDLQEIIKQAKPRVIYTHNPADKHDTHVAVLSTVLRAVRALPQSERPEKLYGCEIWRALDWVQDEEKLTMNIAPHGNVRAALLGVFDSQIAGGKRYDLAAFGRSRANATFFQSHGVDRAEELWYALDLSPLLKDDSLKLKDYTLGFIQRFADDVAGRLSRFLKEV
jgi:LmbE family N-acetylglucosaminyl deacetylase